MGGGGIGMPAIHVSRNNGNHLVNCHVTQLSSIERQLRKVF